MPERNVEKNDFSFCKKETRRKNGRENVERSICIWRSEHSVEIDERRSIANDKLNGLELFLRKYNIANENKRLE